MKRGGVRIGAVSTVRADRTTLRMFVNYHLNVGVEHLFLFFDDPSDPAIDHFKQEDRLTCISCDERYWTASSQSVDPSLDASSIEFRQVHNASLALRWAREQGLDWIAHIDSDELLYAPFGLRRLLDDIDAGAVILPTLEAIPKRSYARHYFTDIQTFRRLESPIPKATRIATRLYRRAATYGYFRAHTEGKAIVRTRSPFAGMGIHSPVEAPDQQVQIARVRDGFVLHFDCCTPTDWITKWQRRYDGTGIARGMRPTRRRQFSGFVAAYESGSPTTLRREYERQCIVSWLELAGLHSLGLLRRVRLDRCLFGDFTASLDRSLDRPD
jgi:hypothetical protein